MDVTLFSGLRRCSSVDEAERVIIISGMRRGSSVDEAVSVILILSDKKIFLNL